MDEPKPLNACFGCGEANPHGMHLQFERDETQQRVRGRFRLGAEYAGSHGMLHGGIIAVVLDEALGKVSRFSDVRTVTAELSVQYLKPVLVGEEIFVEAYQAERNGRQFHHEGEIRNAAGELLARGRGRFVAIDPEKYRGKLKAREEISTAKK